MPGYIIHLCEGRYIADKLHISKESQPELLNDFLLGCVLPDAVMDMTLQGIEGEPIAAALRVAGVMTHRYTKKRHEPRGVFCAIGRCTDCVMIVNGKPNIRTCITPLEEGMDVRTQYGASAEKDF